MSRTNRKYEVRPLGCGWALDIPLGDATVVLYFNSRNNAELVKDILEWEDAHPNEAIPYQPTLTPQNEPLTVEQLREMDGEPVYIHRDIFPEDCGWRVIAEADMLRVYFTDCTSLSLTDYGKSWLAYRRPSERQEDSNGNHSL